MCSQGQFSTSHHLGPAVDVAHYGTLCPPLQGYDSTITALGGPQDIGPVAPSATITFGYTACHTSQTSATTTPYSVALTPQVPAHPQIQYYYESAEPLPSPLQVRHCSSTVLGLKPISPSLPEAPSTPAPGDKAEEASQGPQHYRTSARRKRALGTEGTSAKLSRKRCRNRGEAYISASGKFVPEKKYVEQDCQCRSECLAKLGTVADREVLFRWFWDIGDFGKQNAHLAQSVVLVPSGSSGQQAGTPHSERHFRTVRRLYYVKLKESQTQVRVCKSQFLRLHGVSNGRLDRVLQALHCDGPHALQDRRGQHAPSNKTAREDLELAAQHVLQVHRRGTEMPREATSQVAVGNMSVKKMHQLYQRWCEGQGRTPVSLWVYRQVEKSRLTLWQEEGGCGAAGMISTQARGGSVQQTCGSEDAAVCQEAVLEPAATTTTTTTTTTTNTSTPPPIIAIATTSLPTTTTPTSTTTSLPLTITPNSTTTTTITTTTATALEVTKQRRRRRRRLRKGGQGSPSMSREERKARRNKGEAYVTVGGKVQAKKAYQDRPCGCRHGCIPALGTPEARRQVFDNFWGLASFTRQNAHIARVVALAPLNQRRTGAAQARTYSRLYSIQFKPGGEAVRVCKLAFLRLHGISNGRMDRVLQAVACQSPFALKDRRGRHSPKNKTREEDVRHAFSHMCALPLEDAGQPGRLCLPQQLSVEKMYRLYREKCTSEGRKPVGRFVYRKILKERLLSSRSPHRDLEFARQHLQVTDVRQSETSPAESTMKGLHHDYPKKCAEEDSNAVGSHPKPSDRPNT